MQSERALLVILVIILQGIGLVMIYDSSAIYANEAPSIHDSDFFLKRQLVWVGLGVIALAVLSLVDYRLLIGNALPIFGLSLLSLVLVFVPDIGVKANESYRWLRIGGKMVQPSEFAKLTSILFLSFALSRNARPGRQAKYPPAVKNLLLSLSGIGLCAGLILLEPDFSSTAIVGLLAFIMLFASGTKLRYLFCLVAASVGVLGYKVYTSSYQLVRILAFLDPAGHQTGVAYQQTQSLLALGTGGIFGMGLGLGRQKLGFLPYLYNDFVGASVGEQAGFMGMCVLICLLALFVILGFRIAFRARHLEGYLIAV